jgi:hypothetical protein
MSAFLQQGGLVFFSYKCFFVKNLKMFFGVAARV